MVISMTRESSRTVSPVSSTEEALLTFKEAMNYLRVSRSTIYRLMWSQQLTGHKVGSTWRFYRADLTGCIQLVGRSNPSKGEETQHSQTCSANQTDECVHPQP